MTTRSGLRKSSRAAPSLRNSGFETTLTRWFGQRAMVSRTLPFVPTGTVLFNTTIFFSFMNRPMDLGDAQHMTHIGGAVFIPVAFPPL